VRFDGGDASEARQLRLDEALVGLDALADHVQEIVLRAGHQIAGAHLVPAGDRLLEGRDLLLVLARQPHRDEDGDGQAVGLLVDLGGIAADDARLFQPAQAPEARRRRQAHALRQLLVGHAPVALQQAQHTAVGRVERYLPHSPSILAVPARASTFARSDWPSNAKGRTLALRQLRRGLAAGGTGKPPIEGTLVMASSDY